MKRTWPYTPDELRWIADAVDDVLEKIGTEPLEERDWRWGINRVDVWVDDYVVGYVAPYGDGYMGFYPEEVVDDR